VPGGGELLDHGLAHAAQADPSDFGPVMATAARRTIASVFEVAELGTLDPESIVTPGIHVSAVVQIPRTATQAGGFKDAA
jgi:3-oxoadipate CoA-transferase, alpha subunit